jgi:hypothetical protein
MRQNNRWWAQKIKSTQKGTSLLLIYNYYLNLKTAGDSTTDGRNFYHIVYPIVEYQQMESLDTF